MRQELRRGAAFAIAGAGAFASMRALIYTTVVFAALIGWLVWKEAPDALSVAGGLLVIAAALVVVGLRRAPTPRSAT